MFVHIKHPLELQWLGSNKDMSEARYKIFVFSPN